MVKFDSKGSIVQMRNHPKHSPEPMENKTSPKDSSETSKLIMWPCKFWKIGKCNWGWGCRFLHGNNLSDDPRRPEYRGSPVDFTQPPQHSYLPQNISRSFNQNDEQSRSKALRNPIVEITVSNENSLNLATTLKGLLLKNNINVLQQTKIPIINHEQATSLFKRRKPDFLIFIDSSNIIMFPESVAIQFQQVIPWIQRHWRIMSKNYTIEEIELMTPNSFELLLKSFNNPQLNLTDITITISSFQNKVNSAVVSQDFEDFKSKPEDLVNLRQEISQFFGKLCTLNSIITDCPFYANLQPSPGQIVPSTQEKPTGLSYPLQRSLMFMTQQFMTQTHSCLALINKILGELNQNPSSINFTVAKAVSPGLHPSPYCFISYNEILTPQTSNSPPKTEISIQSRSSQFQRRVPFNYANANTKIEPDIHVEMNSPYQISFRDQNDSNTAFQRPFNQ